MRRTTIICMLLCSAFPASVFAYVGPGLGAGAIGAVIGVIGSIFIGLFAILYYPIKRKLKQRKGQEKKAAEQDVEKQPVEKQQVEEQQAKAQQLEEQAES